MSTKKSYCKRSITSLSGRQGGASLFLSWCFVLFFLLPLGEAGNSFAQINLVQNPSFEDTIQCPTSPAQIKYARYWDTLVAGGGGSPELFSTCNTNLVGVPLNALSFQHPLTGQNYSGLTPYQKTPSVIREYIQNRLKTKLTSNKNYCATIYINLANKSVKAIDQIGLYFDDGSVYAPHFGVTTVSPQIISPAGTFIADTLNWVKIQGTFIANGTEEYLTIGNFKTDLLTNTITTSTGASDFAYYNVDDVSVIEADTKAYAGQDKLICLGDSVFIGRTPEIGLECQWFNNNVQIADGAGIWVKPDTIQQYVIKQDVCGTISFDTVKVSTKNENLCQAINDTLFTVPNTFTPNADGVNDTWQFTLPQSFSLTEFFVYNRWGNLIHQTTNNLTPTTILWDGRTTAGEPCSDGVYFYVLKYTDARGESQNKKGYISLFK